MDTPAEARDYDAMDHSAVNRVFVDDFLAALRAAGLWDRPQADSRLTILDTGTGTALIPIELLSRFAADEIAGLHVTAIDLAAEMLAVAERNVAGAGFSRGIQLARVDCKALPYADGEFDAVTSNSIVHHIPQPDTALAEMWRVLRPGGLLFLRDLLRPADRETLDALVQTYAGDENPHQRQMFRDSLQAALALDELRGLLSDVGIPPAAARQTTDRHWTLAVVREV
ncbi:MAG: class I SAM-dependent methyltransferase [Planctomycetaceae bacterium]